MGLNETMSLEQRRRVQVLEDIRNDTVTVRNQEYPHQTGRIVRDLFGPMEDLIEQRLGVRISHLIDMCETINQTVDQRLDEMWKPIKEIAKKNTIPSELRAIAREKKIDLREIQQRALLYTNEHLPEAYTFNIDEFCAAYPVQIDTDILRPILNVWAFQFGELKDQNPEYFFMGNPIWQKPLIRLNTDVFFWPLNIIFYSFCLELMEEVLKPHTDLYNKYRTYARTILMEGYLS